MRPSLSMAMPPLGLLNCPLPEPWLPMVRTWPPSGIPQHLHAMTVEFNNLPTASNATPP
jgi:hypothetical protein